MSLSSISEGFKAFQALRDDCLEGLLLCSFTVSMDELENLDYQLIRSEFYDEKGEEHEFHEYKKGSERVVYLESYLEKEGGMFMRTLYANPLGMKTLKPLKKSEQ